MLLFYQLLGMNFENPYGLYSHTNEFSLCLSMPFGNFKVIFKTWRQVLNLNSPITKNYNRRHL